MVVQFRRHGGRDRLETMRASLVCLVLLSTTAFADTITTKDGTRYDGRILDRTATGYLFRSVDGQTSVIDFAQVDDVQRDDAPVVETKPLLVPQESRQVPMLMELHRLQTERIEQASLFMPIFATAGGSGAALVGSVLLTSAVQPNDRQLGGLLLVGGGAMVITGIVIGAIRIGRRVSLGGRIEALEKEARSLGIALPRED